MDQLLFAQISLIVAVIGVIGTFVAPRLVPSSRVHFEPLDVSQIARRDPTERIKIRVLHDDVIVDDPVYMVRAQVINVGNRDITRSEFIEPAQIRLPANSEFLSIDLEAADGVGEQIMASGSKADLNWAILKPSESINIRIIFSNSSLKFDQKDTDEIISFVARLRDVKVGLGIRKYARITTIAVVSVVVSGAIVALAQFGASLSSDRWVYKDNKTGVQFAILEPNWPVRSEFQSCEIVGGRASLTCRALTQNEAQTVIATANRARIERQLAPWFIVVLACVTLLYAAMIATAGHRFMRLRNLRRLGRRFSISEA